MIPHCPYCNSYLIKVFADPFNQDPSAHQKDCLCNECRRTFTVIFEPVEVRRHNYARESLYVEAEPFPDENRVNRPDVEEAPTRRIRVNQADVSVVSGTDEHASEQPKS